MKPARVAFASLVAVASLATAAPGSARPDPAARFGDRRSALVSPRRLLSHGAAGGPSTENFEVLSHIRFDGLAPDADVTVFDHGSGIGTFAYVGSTSFECGDARGVSIVDVGDPQRPRLVARARVNSDTTTEDVAVERIGDRVVLAVGMQPCGPRARIGLRLFDVTDPSSPVRLSTLPQPAGGVHELDVVTRPDGRTLALLAVPFAEADTLFSGIDFGSDVRIVDISDPAEPDELGSWGVIGDSDLFLVRRPEPIDHPFQGLGELTVHFAHSVRAADEGMTAYVSYWDGGVLRLDISDPSAPVLVGRTRYPIDSEGEAHSVVPYETAGTRYLFQADEDAHPGSPALVTSSVTGDSAYQALEEPWLPTTLTETGELSGAIADAGDGCETSDFAAAEGAIALADLYGFSDNPPPCGIGGIALRAARAGAGALVLNYIAEDDPFAFGPGPRKQRRLRSEATGMPAVVIAADDGLAEALRMAAGPAAPEATLSPQRAGFGFLRVFRETGSDDVDSDGFLDYPQVGRFDALRHVLGDPDATEGFRWTIHNPEVSGDRLYASWYEHGIVALDISDPTTPVKVGQFVPTSGARKRYFGDPTALTWGVAIGADGLIYVSDIRSGLWIVRPTGAAAPAS